MAESPHIYLLVRNEMRVSKGGRYPPVDRRGLPLGHVGEGTLAQHQDGQGGVQPEAAEDGEQLVGLGEVAADHGVAVELEVAVVV